MLERLLGTGCSSVSGRGTSVFADLIKGPQGRGRANKNNFKCGRNEEQTYARVSEELLLKAALGTAKPSRYLQKWLSAGTNQGSLCVCAQVFKPRARCHATRHSWRIHLHSGMSSSNPRRAQWTPPPVSFASLPSLS